MSLRVIDAWWSNSPDGTIGVIVAENDAGCRKVRIGKITPGGDERSDATMIADMGGKLSLVALKEIVATLGGGKSYE